MKIKYVSPEITVETLTLSSGIVPSSPIAQQNKDDSARKKKITGDNNDTAECERSEN